MGKKKIEFVEKINNFYKNKENSVENLFVNKRVVFILINNIKNLSIEQKLQLLDNKNNSGTDFTKLFMKNLSNELDSKNMPIKAPELINKDVLLEDSCNNILNNIKKLTDSNVFNEVFNSTYNEYLVNKYDLNKELDNQSTINFINECEKVLGDNAIDSIIPDSNYYDKPENTIGLKQILYKKEVIDELKQSNPTDSNVLDDASKITAEFSDNWERMGFSSINNESYNKRVNDEINLINKDGLNGNIELINKDGLINFNSTNTENNQETIKDIYKKEIMISSKDKEKIKDVFNKIVALDDSTFIEKLSLSKASIKKAIDNKDIDKIKEGVNNYKDVEKQYLDLFNDINSLGNQKEIPKLLPLGNQNGASIAVAKNQRATAIYKALFKLNKELKNTSITIDDVLNNPMQAVKDYLTEKQENSPINKMLKEKPVYDSIDALFQNNKQIIKEQEEYFNNCLSVYAGLDGINCLLSEGDLEFGAYTKSAISPILEDFTPNIENLLRNDVARVEKVIKNLLMFDDEHRDLMTVQVEPKFDMNTLEYNEPYLLGADYLRTKGSCEDIIVRLVENTEIVNSKSLNSEPKENEYEPNLKYIQKIIFSHAIKSLAKDILDNVKLDRDSKRICKALRDGKFDKVSKQDKEHFLASAKVKLAKNKNTIKQDFGNHMKTLVDLEEDYKNRSRFWKIFGRETHRLKRTIESIKKDLKEQLPNKQEFDKLYNDIKEGRVNPSDISISDLNGRNTIKNNLDVSRQLMNLNNEFGELSNDGDASIASDNSEQVLESDKLIDIN